jgi:hypothetical protein
MDVLKVPFEMTGRALWKEIYFRTQGMWDISQLVIHPGYSRAPDTFALAGWVS